MASGPSVRTKKSVIGIGLGLSVCLAIHAASAQTDDKHPIVIIETSMGAITIELDADKAPITVENFLKYVDGKFYDKLIFHRVIKDFMIQGGGLDEDLHEKTEGQKGTIKNESNNGLSNVKGTIAMARKSDPDSATNQFFINVEDNSRLDHYKGGYTVFGKVTDGMDVVDKIRIVRTKDISDEVRDVPVEPVFIKSVRRKEKDKK